MSTPPISNNKLLVSISALEKFDYNISHASDFLGIPRSTIQHHIKVARSRGLIDGAPKPELIVSAARPVDESIEELLERKKAHMTRAIDHETWAKLIPVTVTGKKPIGICLVGDPHLDDDHCDIAQLEQDLKTVGGTDGFYAGHLGDITNNWVGRLQRLYAYQSARFSDGLKLAEWMFGLCPNLFVVGGNHDMWNNGMDRLRFITHQSRTGVVQAHGARIALRWESGEEIRIHARHDFPGRSQFSDTHGMKRELLFGWKDHVIVAGHTHVDEARVEPSIDGMAHWLFRVSGYKVIDDFAKEKGFRPKRLAPSVSIIVNPSARVEAEKIKPFWDVEAASDYLTFIRQKPTSARTKSAKR
jgi:predicted phosphodiesterase